MKITIDSVEYEIDVQAAKSAGILKPVFVSPKVGDKFKYTGFNWKYILARLSNNEVILININNGNRWSNAVKVVDSHKITESEWEKLTGGETFTKISD
jgi:hypothetical protein